MHNLKLRRRASLFIAACVTAYVFLAPSVNLLLSLLPLEKGKRLTDSVYFFAFEAPKVLLLLLMVVFGIGIVRSYFSPERTRKLLGKRSPLIGNVMASTLGIVTPFCSCSAVPLFIGFVEAGVPLGATFSFLVAAPMINEIAVVLLLGLFGWQTALIYISTGLFIAITSGYIIGKLKVERFVEKWVYTLKGSDVEVSREMTIDDRIEYGFTAVRDIVGRVWVYVLVGIAVGAGIHGYVPENFMASLMGKSAWWAVPASVLIGVPLYSNAAGIIPIVQALLQKGASLGTALAFMMSVIGLSFPETIILRKVLKIQLIAIFVGVVAAGIVSVGYLFNFIY
jgi:uncharacterized protein